MAERTLEIWAEAELARLQEPGDEMQTAMNQHLMTMVRAFSAEGHSGFSAFYAIRMLTRLLSWKPLTSLTGEDSEWNRVGDDTDQNRRCSAVFRKHGDNSTAYYIEGRVFSDDGGRTWWTNRDSRIPVTFPYHVPDEPERVIVDEAGVEVEEGERDG